MGATVSVIVPTHNYGRFLAESVTGALSQTRQDLEVIVVDDGSTDDTPRVAQALMRADPRVSYVRQDRRGPAAARNRGLARATGPYVALLDADDAWLPDLVAQQVETLQVRPELG